MPKDNKEANKAIRKLRIDKAKFKRQSWSIKELKNKFKQIGLSDDDLAKVKLTERFGLGRYLINDVKKFWDLVK